MQKFILSIAAVFAVATVSSEVHAKHLMFMPFKYGTKAYCVQGNFGSYSHTGTWKYAYDFTLGSKDKTFGASVYSPVNGTVVEVRIGAPDYKYNYESSANNNNGWGNTVLLKDGTTGMYVRLAHMKDGSVKVKVGNKVKVTQKIGQIGCSGYSSGPHLHVQLQDDPSGADQSIEFDFVEGGVAQGGWYTSELAYLSFIGDNGGVKSLSHEFQSFATAGSTSWTYYESETANRTVGGNYYKIKKLEDKTPKYDWIFKLKKTGIYAVYVKASCVGKKDPAALYHLSSNDDDDFETDIEVDQSECSEYDWHFLVVTMFTAGDLYHVTLYPSTDGTYSVADGFKFIRLYP